VVHDRERRPLGAGARAPYRSAWLSRRSRYPTRERILNYRAAGIRPSLWASRARLIRDGVDPCVVYLETRSADHGLIRTPRPGRGRTSRDSRCKLVKNRTREKPRSAFAA
jgi:hypothetical protein